MWNWVWLFLRRRTTRGIQYYNYYSPTFGAKLGAPKEERVTASSVLASLNGTYRWQPEKTVSSLVWCDRRCV